MSGTPGQVSLSSVCERLFHRPRRATRRWNGRNPLRNRRLELGSRSAATNNETAASYSAFRFAPEKSSNRSRLGKVPLARRQLASDKEDIHHWAKAPAFH